MKTKQEKFERMLVILARSATIELTFKFVRNAHMKPTLLLQESGERVL